MSTFSDTVTLLLIEEGTDEAGSLVSRIVRRTSVYAEMKSVGYREFYQAAAVGMKPTLVFTLAYYPEYRQEQQLEYQGRRYDIIRSYRAQGEQIELTVSGPIDAEEGEGDGST